MRIGLGALTLVLLVVGVVIASVRLAHHRPATGPAARTTHTAAVARPAGAHASRRTHPARPAAGVRPSGRLAADLDRWVRDGLIEPAQAEAIARHEQRLTAMAPVPAPAPAPVAGHRSRIPLVAEALGYIGGVLGLVGVLLLVQRSWADLGTAVRLAMTVGATVLAVLGGALVHEHRDPAAARLRGALWAVATATAGVFGHVLATDVLEVSTGELVAATTAAGVLAAAAPLWWNRPRPLQQLASLGAAVVLAGTLVEQVASPTVAGLAASATGAAMLAAGIALVTSIPALTVGVGAAATIFGSLLVAGDTQRLGLPLACLTAAALLALALTDTPVARDNQRVVLSVFGIIGVVQAVPQTIVWFAREAAVITGGVMWLIGLALVALGVRRRLRAAPALEVIGGLTMLGGAAVTGVQSVAVATIAGTLTAVGSIALGARPGRVLMSVTGSVGLLVFVPWTIAHFFPGEGRAPLLILVAGAVLVAVAVGMTRQAGRFRRELGPGADAAGPGHADGSERAGVDVDADEQPTEGLVQTR